MSWLDHLKGDPLPWLLEPDPENPGIRYLALRDLMDKPTNDPEVIFAQEDVINCGPVPRILDAQHPDGYWVEPGPGYFGKYRSTVWQIIFLAQLGADGSDPSIQRGCEYVLDHSRSEYGGFSIDGKKAGMIHCLQGNLIAALLEFGMYGDERLQDAIEWMARSITGEGIAPSEERTAPVRYLRSGNSGPGFACSANNHLPCAWGAVKAMLAFSKIPAADRDELVKHAIQQGLVFLLSHDPAKADYPMGYAEKPNQSWFKFGYPIAYVTDVLQNLEVLTALGCGKDKRLKTALEMVINKQDNESRWKMEYTYNGKTWVEIEEKGKPSKWVTLRALRVLKQADTIAL